MAVRLSTGAVNALAGGGAGDGSFKDVFANAVIVIRAGTQPATADAVETGDVLGMITVGGGAFTGGSATNGLNWDAAWVYHERLRRVYRRCSHKWAELGRCRSRCVCKTDR